MLKALFQNRDNHPYNKAVNLWQTTKRLHNKNTGEFESGIIEVINYCKAAIKQNKNDGDAHVLLANAYYISTLPPFPPTNYPMFFPFAVAVIQEWEYRNLWTKNRDNGIQLYRIIFNALQNPIDYWTLKNAPIKKDMESLQLEFYSQAIGSSVEPEKSMPKSENPMKRNASDSQNLKKKGFFDDYPKS